MAVTDHPTDDSDRLSMRFIDGHYAMEEDGYTTAEPILHLFCRGEDMCKHHVRVEGFYPYFYIRLNDALQASEQLNNDHRVRKIETVEDDGSAISTTIGGEGVVRLARLYTVAPYHVPQLRDNFDDHWEADVLFVDRFCYDTGIVDTLSVPQSVRTSTDPISVDAITADDVQCNVSTRIGYIDIEVQQSAEGPSVVSEKGRELADNPITAVTIYDSYTRTYTAFILAHESNDQETYQILTEVNSDIRVFSTEWELLADVASYVADYQFDVLTAWNAPFDFPYLINRYFSLGHMDVYQLSPTDGIDELDGKGTWMNSDVEGVILFDMLKGYEKSQIHELEDSSLATVAAHETDIEKLDIDGIDDAWVNDPQMFVEYSIRDVEATVKIDAARGILT